MISCDSLVASDFTSSGYHECSLSAASFSMFKCGWDDTCWTFSLHIHEDRTPPITCNVEKMSITIDGILLPVLIHTSANGWPILLKDKPTKDAVVHWAIVPCRAAP